MNSQILNKHFEEYSEAAQVKEVVSTDVIIMIEK